MKKRAKSSQKCGTGAAIIRPVLNFEWMPQKVFLHPGAVKGAHSSANRALGAARMPLRWRQRSIRHPDTFGLASNQARQHDKLFEAALGIGRSVVCVKSVDFGTAAVKRSACGLTNVSTTQTAACLIHGKLNFRVINRQAGPST